MLATLGTVMITGYALVSRTPDDLLTACRNSWVIVYGSSASLLPLPLFQRPQVTAVTTIRVTDGPRADGHPGQWRAGSRTFL